jgi:hypothetical protein
VFNFPELFDTRPQMLEAFRADEARSDLPPYRPDGLTPVGMEAWPSSMEAAITEGNEMTLMHDLDFAPYWIAGTQLGSFTAQAKRAAVAEFNTWYVRGLCLRLMDEGVDTCGVYLAETTIEQCDECQSLASVLEVKKVFDGHRARYHHPAPDPMAVSVPLHEDCHHSIRRLTVA